MTDGGIRRCLVCGAQLPRTSAKYCSVACYRLAGATVCDHICVDCGVSFRGHIRSTRCPECRAEHKRELARKCRQRSRRRLTREMGSKDFCERCGAVYTVLNPAQKYCEACAPIAIRERIRKRNNRQQANRREKGIMKISDAITRKRIEHGLTQKELAEKIGCYPKDVCRWETGVRKPTAESLVKIAKALDCTLDDLVT